MGSEAGHSKPMQLSNPRQKKGGAGGGPNKNTNTIKLKTYGLPFLFWKVNEQCFGQGV